MKKAGRYTTMTSSLASRDAIVLALREAVAKKAEEDGVEITNEILRESSSELWNGNVLTMVTIHADYQAV